ncbi:hypothetical protein [Pelotalea chapellei]|uniref:Uncharacterized protein n=1 Tax=Pelotalea chapellei TaxID=44671 RepID=A0ABS5UBL5_9BACT|nr:hypothetical protein [Pelotalea chapellei]MBT1073070.1 hypothetical protein [Pelotalea chapellei]
MQASIPLIAGLVILAFVVSLPCGYLRENFKKYSFMWFLLIHLPIPFIILLRIKAGLDWHVIPLTLGGSVAGQVMGGILNRRRKRNGKAG